MKASSRALLLCVLGLAAHETFAANVSANFTASVTLTSVCQVKTGSNNQTLDFGTYTAFGSSQTATSINIDFECTRGFAASPTVAFDTGTDKTSTSGSSATGAGVVGGLQYTVAVAAGVKTAGTAATTSSIGTADTYRYAVSGAMAAGQAGDSSAATTQARVLTITY